MIWIIAWIGCGFLAGYLQHKYEPYYYPSREDMVFYCILGLIALILVLISLMFTEMPIDLWCGNAFRCKKK